MLLVCHLSLGWCQKCCWHSQYRLGLLYSDFSISIVVHIVIIIIIIAIFIFSEELVTNHETISDEESCTLLSLKKVYLTGLMILQKVAGLSDRATILVIHFFSAFLTLFATLFRIPILFIFAKSIPQTHGSSLHKLLVC